MKQCQPKTVDVGTDIQWPNIQNLLRRNVSRSSNHMSRGGCGAIDQTAGNSKISEFALPRLCHKDIAGFYIPVQNLILMQNIQRKGYVPERDDCFFLRQPVFRFDDFLQRPPVDILHHLINVFLRFFNLDNLHQVGMPGKLQSDQAASEKTLNIAAAFNPG